MARPAFKNRAKIPYNYLLYTHMAAEGLTVAEYAAGPAMTARWDIIHVHWPESLLETCSLVGCLWSVLKAGLAIGVARARGAKLVWTIHDLRPHDHVYPRIERAFWRWFVARVDGAIALTPDGWSLAEAAYPRLAHVPVAIVPHGHFRDLFEDGVTQAAARRELGLPAGNRVLLFFGQIRPYKGLTRLIKAFVAAALPDTVLVIAGRPNKRTRYDQVVAAAAAGHPRIVTVVEFIPDERIQLFMRAADLVVCPFEAVLNSGSVILALSFNRPVLAPALGALVELRHTVGPDWLMTYDGKLDPAILAEAMARVTVAPPVGRPDLAALAWPAIARATMAAYHRFIAAT